MSEYGLSGSATYAVTFDTFDQLMDVLPDNDVQQITAQNMRNVVYTLWENGGGGGGSFSYTQTAPFSQGSVNPVGGIGSGTTFSNVPLQDLFDRMFFPAVGGAYTISTQPSSLEFGLPNPKTTVSVSITKKNPDIDSINVSGGPGNTFVPPQKPTTFNEKIDKNYPNTNVFPDVNTTYTLTVVDSTGTKTPQASVNWFFPRWYGSIDLNSLLGISFTSLNITPSQKDEIINKLKFNTVTGEADWKPVWSPSTLPNVLTSFRAESSPLGTVTVIPKNVALGSHTVLIWPSTDYGGDGDPINYTYGQLAGRPFVDLGIHPVQNQYETIRNCRIWIRDYKSAGTETFTINN